MTNRVKFKFLLFLRGNLKVMALFSKAKNVNKVLLSNSTIYLFESGVLV